MLHRLPKHQALRARQIELSLALLLRIGLLAALSWLIGMRHTLFSAFGIEFSWRDLILAFGGLFLIAKATHEMHVTMEEAEEENLVRQARRAFGSVVVQVVILDLVFAIVSILTAIGMAQHLEVMITAVIIAVGIIFLASGPLSAFISTSPITKMLALAFLQLIGVTLVAEAFGVVIPKGIDLCGEGFFSGCRNAECAGRRQTPQAGHTQTA